MRFNKVFKRRQSKKGGGRDDSSHLDASEKSKERLVSVSTDGDTSSHDEKDVSIDEEKNTEEDSTQSSVSITEVKVIQKDDARVCNCCGKLGAKARCGACLVVFYCSEECQTKDWEDGKHWENCGKAPKESSAKSEPKGETEEINETEDNRLDVTVLCNASDEENTLSTGSGGCISFEENSIAANTIATSVGGDNSVEKDIAVEVNIMGVAEETKNAQPEQTKANKAAFTDLLQVNVIVDNDKKDDDSFSTIESPRDYGKKAKSKKSHSDGSVKSVFTLESRSIGIESLDTISEENSRNIYNDDDNTLAGKSIGGKSTGTSTTVESQSTDESADTSMPETLPPDTYSTVKSRRKRNVATHVLSRVLEQVADKGACVCQEGKRVVKGCRETRCGNDDDSLAYYDGQDDSTIGSFSSEIRMYY